MIGPGVRFLDVGCGCGRVARFLLDEPLAEYVGFDRNPSMIHWCNEYLAPIDSRFTFESFSIRTPYESLDGIGGDVTAEQFVFPYADDRFDCILLASAFTDMALGEIDHYLRELWRVLSAGGSPGFGPVRRNRPYNASGLRHRPDDLIRVFEERGFRGKELGTRGSRGIRGFSCKPPPTGDRLI